MEDTHILDSLDLNDTGFNGLQIHPSGELEIEISFDPDWNKTFPVKARGLLFNYVYELLEFRTAGLSFLGEHSYKVLQDYNRSSSEIGAVHNLPVIEVEICNIAGDKISFICADSIEFLY